MCKRKGTMVTTINKNDLKVVKGKDKIKTYQFNTNVAKHENVTMVMQLWSYR